MSKFIIQGGKKLAGEIKVAGSKNALFPLLAAALLTEEGCRFTNVPEIKDREVMIELLKDLGVSVEVSGSTVVVNAKNLAKSELKEELTSKLRGSVVLLGALLARSGKAKMNFPGGDVIGKRPVDAHLAVFRAFGASVAFDKSIDLAASKLTGAKVVLEESSVTATENAILVATRATGQTQIKLAAMEPHVQQLCEFLNLMGAKISGIGRTTFAIE